MDFTQRSFAMDKLGLERLTRWTDTNTKNQRKVYFYQLSMKIRPTEGLITDLFKEVSGSWFSKFSLSKSSKIFNSMSRSYKFIMRRFMICWIQACSSEIGEIALFNQLFITLVPPEITTLQVSNLNGTPSMFIQLKTCSISSANRTKRFCDCSIMV